MRKIAMLAAGTIVAFSLTSCADAQPGATDITACGGDVEKSAGCETTIMYKGQPLNCVTWDGSHGEVGLTCDFVEYHARSGQ